MQISFFFDIMLAMNRKALPLIMALCLFSLAFAQETGDFYKDDISRIELLGFHYFPIPLFVSPGKLFDSEGEGLLIDGSSETVLLIAFLGARDPFNEEMRKGLTDLSAIYGESPFHVVIISDNREDYKDREGRCGKKWGVINYPTFLLIDHNFRLRASAEGIYPDFGGEDFRKVIDDLLLDIKAPGIINTLK